MLFHRAPTDNSFLSVRPEPLYIFKNVSPTEKLDLPELSENRSVTNCYIFMIFGLALLIWGLLTFHVVYKYGNKRAVKNEDLCGNVCGESNTNGWENETCEAQDYRDFDLSVHVLQDDKYVPVSCTTVESCISSGGYVGIGRCFFLTPEMFNSSSVEKAVAAAELFMIFDVIFRKNWPIIITVGFSIGAALVMGKVAQCNMFKTIKFSVLVGITHFLQLILLRWYFEFYKTEKSSLFFWILNGLLLLTVIFLIVFVYRKLIPRMTLVTAIYEESAKAIFAHFLLVALPFLSIAFMFLVYGLSLYLVLMVLTNLTQAWIVRNFYFCLLGIMLIWVDLFVAGCQCMVVAGATAFYFFTRNKPTVKLSILRSVSTLIQNHLGTVAAGSFLLIIFKIFNGMVKIMKNCNEKNVLAQIFLSLVTMCCGDLQEVAYYLTRKAYIITAIHGESFYKSGQRAARLLWFFLLDAVLLDGLVFWAIYTLAFAIIITAVLICYGVVLATDMMEHSIYYLLVGLYLSYTVIYYFTALINVAAETMFLCFCEDRFLNDGSLIRPYFMPKIFSDIVMSYARQEQQKINEQYQAQ